MNLKFINLVCKSIIRKIDMFQNSSVSTFEPHKPPHELLMLALLLLTVTKVSNVI